MKTKIGIVGFGHLGYVLYIALTKLGYEVLVNNGSYLRTIMKLDSKDIDRSRAVTISHMAEECQIILLCIRSKDLEFVGYKLSKVLTEDHLLLSFLAQTSLYAVEDRVGRFAVVVKVMTTLGVAEHKGVSAYQLGAATEQEAKLVCNLIQQISADDCVFWLDSEEEMQLFTIGCCLPGVLASFLRLLVGNISNRSQSLGNYEKVVPILLESTSAHLKNAGSLLALEEEVATKGGITQTMNKSLEDFGLAEAVNGSVEAGLNKMNR